MTERISKRKTKREAGQGNATNFGKIQKVDHTKKSLQRSLAGSRQSSPAHSPKVGKRTTSRRSAKDTRLVQTKSREEKREYADIFDSLLKLKQGDGDYASLVANAMEATDQLLELKSSRESESAKSNKDTSKKSKQCTTNKVGKPGRGLKAASKAQVEGVMETIDRFANNNACDNSDPDLAKSLLAALKGTKDTQQSKAAPEKTMKLLSKIKQCVNSNKEEATEGGVNTQESNDRKKKLVSGKCAKPEESDIHIVVKYPHEKLDPKHVKDRCFDSLEFNILIAGELEIASLENINADECKARIDIAKTLLSQVVPE